MESSSASHLNLNSTTDDANANAAANNNNNNNKTQEDEEEESYFTSLYVSDPITTTFQLYFQNARLFLSLAAVVVLPILLSFWILFWTRNVHLTYGGGDYSSSEEGDDTWVWVVLFFATLAAFIVILVLGTTVHAAMIRAVTEIYIGQQQHEQHEQHEHEQQASLLLVNLKRLLCEGWRKVGILLCYGMIIFFGQFVFAFVWNIAEGLLLLIFVLPLTAIAGQDAGNVIKVVILIICRIAYYFVYYYIMLGFFAVRPTIVVEQQQGNHGGGVQWAMERSWELTSGRRLFIFGAKCMISIVIWLPYFLLYFTLISLTGATDPASLSIGTGTAVILLLALPFMIIVPVYSIFVAVIYLNLRIQKEGCQQSVLARDLGWEQSGDSTTHSVCNNDTMYNSSPSQITEYKNLEIV